MKNLWNDEQARGCGNDALVLRVYTSRLLGQEPNLVLHGGGNTSVKITEPNLFGEQEDLLYVKGSGWDLATIEAAGFAPVKMDVLTKMATLDELSDSKMVSVQRTAMTNPSAPNPSVEAILHAIIPFKYVDHTHADAVVTITNSPAGEKRIREIYGDNILIIPYVMPGFILSQKVYEMTKDYDWSKCEGMILMNHGIFTFDDDAKASYTKMIDMVTQAEEYLSSKDANVSFSPDQSSQQDHVKIAQIRKTVSLTRGQAQLASLRMDDRSLSFAQMDNVSDVTSRGPLTPDHVIRTKRTPLVIGQDISESFSEYQRGYEQYFADYRNNGQTCLDPAPRWAVWPGQGVFSFGRTLKELQIISDITEHTIDAICAAETLGGWQPLPAKDIYDVEYWELEQAKLKKAGSAPQFQGKVAVVTGAASGIGKACVEHLAQQGAVVVAIDINPDMEMMFANANIRGAVCDVTDQSSVQQVINDAIVSFGGIDILVSNAGIFTANEPIANMQPETWSKSLDINLSSHQRLLQMLIPFLSEGIDPAVIIVASKNVPAPGPGAAAYSVAKAGLTQLARVAALELGKYGIRVNIVHPNQVFDTAIWTDEVLEGRAKHYQMSVEEYKKNNLLKVEISSHDVADLVCAMAGPLFAKTTGAQIPIDGGNERVI